MGYNFQPKTDKQLEEMDLWKEADYNFRVKSAVIHISKEGNESIKLTLSIYNGEATKFIDDYIGGTSAFGERKLKHACKAMGLSEQYDSGNLEPEYFEGRSGTISLAIQKSTNPQYPADKNAIKAYLVNESVSAHNQAKQNGYQPDSLGHVDQDVPF